MAISSQKQLSGPTPPAPGNQRSVCLLCVCRLLCIEALLLCWCLRPELMVSCAVLYGPTTPDMGVTCKSLAFFLSFGLGQRYMPACGIAPAKTSPRRFCMHHE